MKRPDLVWLLVLGCHGTTGDSLVTFPAFAAGAPGAAQPFVVGGYTVQLTAARMHIGAVYVNQAPVGTQSDTPVCINPGIYAAQVAAPVDVDLLDPTPQPWTCSPPNCVPAYGPTQGDGTADVGQSWELWLTDATPSGGADSINNLNFDHVVDLQGVATRMADGIVVPFATIVSINASNRGTSAVNPATPGQNPICKQRIVLVGGVDVALAQGGTLTVTIDPRRWFTLESELDFASLPLTTDLACSSAPPYGDEAISIDPLSDYGPAVCEATDGSGQCAAGASVNPLFCTDAAMPCNRPTHCIPNSNHAPGADGTIAAELFRGISASQAYTLTFP